MAENSQENGVDSLDFEIRFLEGVLKESPHFIEALINLGDLYTKRGLYRQGLEIDLRLSALRPNDPIVLYNLACSYSLLADLHKAFEVIQVAIAKGYQDFRYLAQDEDLANLRQFPPFVDLVAQLKPKQRKKIA